MSDAILFKVSEIPWEEGSLELAAIRHRVFVIEQRIVEELEWDGIDPSCLHVLARDLAGRPIGTGRLLVADGRIGRMAVLEAWRGKGVGQAMLERLMAMARREGQRAVVLSAQTYALPFYAKHGFVPEGEEFMEAGIAHRTMRRQLY
jgi:predicted GNAT family N-acyltransferase